MPSTTDFLTSIRCIVKLQENMLKAICEKYRLSLIEAKIISFLYNHPEKDTAADIVEFRMLSKGNVSQAVETLIQKSLLTRQQDTADRRKAHLSLLPKANPITQEIKAMQKEFHREIFFKLSAEDQQQFTNIIEKIKNNAQNAIKRRETL